jgi:hypothetical protein
MSYIDINFSWQIRNPIIILILKNLLDDLNTFFSDPPSCLMIYRNLPEISKNLILRVINSLQNGQVEPFQIKNYDLYINTNKNISTFCTGLKKLGILKDFPNYVIFNEVFITTMKKILSEGLQNEENIIFHRKPKAYEKSLKKGMKNFYRFMNEKIFDQINKNENSNYINNFLTKKNILHVVEGKYQLGSKALTLFLNSTEDLIRNFFQLYFSFCYEKNFKREEKIKFSKFIFYLSSLEPGAYFDRFPEKYFDSCFKNHLDFMNQTGFLIEKKDKSLKQKKYFCTPLIQCLIEYNNISKNYSLIKYGDENAERFLFVETNMKFYAYMPYNKNSNNNQNLSLNALSSINSSMSSISAENEDNSIDYKKLFNTNLLTTMFTIEMILPNMLIGYITRENLRKLYKNSDSNCEKFLKFLSDHMSLKYDDVTEINGNKYFINESVVNQILILDKEKKSINYKPAVCYYDFYDKKQYELYYKKMKELDVKIYYVKDYVKGTGCIVIADTDDNHKKMEKIIAEDYIKH